MEWWVWVLIVALIWLIATGRLALG